MYIDRLSSASDPLSLGITSEMSPVKVDCTEGDVIRLLSIECILITLDLPAILRDGPLMDALEDNCIVIRQDDGRYTITALGALLFARDLSRFGMISSKALRLARYNGDSRVEIGRQCEYMRGYVLGFDDIICTIMMMIPSREVIIHGRAEPMEDYPEKVITEVLVKAMVDQNLSERGTSLSLEVFGNRMEISYPGGVLWDGDWSTGLESARNVRMASMMGRVTSPERKGSIWRRSADPEVRSDVPAPRAVSYGFATRVTIDGPDLYQT